MIRRATPEDLQLIARTLGRAFVDDPAYIAMLPTDREARTAKVLRRILEVAYLAKNEIWVSDDLRAVAVWAPPRQWKISIAKQLRLVPLAAIIGSRSILALRILNGIAARHPPGDHHYLAFLGVDPEAQGQGLGSRVLAPVFERGGGFYLETTNPKNHGFYRRHDFAPIDTVSLPAGVSATLMMRDRR
ncbi:MAG: GNAT family N-acetyltransferase [Deltaproteobacteria bacterium]|nr:GNAT family N-acetyltransferase [Deltaproteobacteria bacterium]